MAKTMPKKGSRIPERLNEIIVKYTVASNDSFGYGNNFFWERLRDRLLSIIESIGFPFKPEMHITFNHILHRFRFN